MFICWGAFSFFFARVCRMVACISVLRDVLPGVSFAMSASFFPSSLSPLIPSYSHAVYPPANDSMCSLSGGLMGHGAVCVQFYFLRRCCSEWPGVCVRIQLPDWSGRNFRNFITSSITDSVLSGSVCIYLDLILYIGSVADMAKAQQMPGNYLRSRKTPLR
jgi:hypothetical protein